MALIFAVVRGFTAHGKGELRHKWLTHESNMAIEEREF
jgi:hypothetical protein